MRVSRFWLSSLDYTNIIAFFDKNSKVKSTETNEIHVKFAYFAPFLRVPADLYRIYPLNEKYPPGYRGVLYFR